MAAFIVTVTKIGASGTNIQIKVNDAHPIPSQIITDGIQSFRTWDREDGCIFAWTKSDGHETFMVVLRESIGWILSSLPIDSKQDKFRIDSPCVVTIEEEVLPPL